MNEIKLNMLFLYDVEIEGITYICSIGMTYAIWGVKQAITISFNALPA